MGRILNSLDAIEDHRVAALAEMEKSLSKIKSITGWP